MAPGRARGTRRADIRLAVPGLSDGRTLERQLAPFRSWPRASKLSTMSHRISSWSSSISALDARDHLVQLETERALALHEGLGDVDVYMADLKVEIEHQRELYLAVAVAEIARLRAELFGPQVG